MTGGGAMFVQPDAAITYSIYLPERYVEGLSFAESYAVLDSWVVATFRDLGVDAWYAPLNDITSAEGKIGGAAQADGRRRSCTTRRSPTRWIPTRWCAFCGSARRS